MRAAWLVLTSLLASAQIPGPTPGGASLPNGWKLTPAGKPIPTEDMVLGLLPSPDGKAVIALHSGFNPHGLVVIDAKTEEAVQRIGLKSAWMGLAWSPDGRSVYVSGGNANSRSAASRAPIYRFGYENGRLGSKPAATLEESVDLGEIYWAGLVHHPTKPLLFAANRGTTAAPGSVVAFDTGTGKLLKRIKVEVNPYDVVLSADGSALFVSNWGSDSVSVIDTVALKVVASIAVGDNPNDMELHPDGRLFVSCSQDNSVVVIDTKTRQATERINTALFPRSPEGSTPNALTLDRARNLLYAANADNNDVAVIRVAEANRSEVMGFIPTGWYPSSVALTDGGKRLWVGNSKGGGGYSNVRGPHSPLPPEARAQGP